MPVASVCTVSTVLTVASEVAAVASSLFVVAMVIPSAVIRGVLKVILSIAPMPCPHAVFNELDEANRWAGARIAAT